MLLFLKVFMKWAVYIFVYSIIASFHPSSSLFINEHLTYVGYINKNRVGIVCLNILCFCIVMKVIFLL